MVIVDLITKGSRVEIAAQNIAGKIWSSILMPGKDLSKSLIRLPFFHTNLLKRKKKHMAEAFWQI